MIISVIVPVYNRFENFRSLFLCLLKQNKKFDELIIADDGSNENIINYITDLLPKVNFKIKHIYHEDKGFRKTRILNEAVKNSMGDLLIFCDQDLIFGEDYVERMSETEEKEFRMCRPCNTEEIEKNEIIKKLESGVEYKKCIENIPIEYENSVNKALKKDRVRRILKRLKLKKRGIKLLGMSYSLWKKDYRNINGYDEKYIGWGYEDDDFGNRLTASGVRGIEVYTDQILLHLWHQVSSSKKESLNEKYYRERKKRINKKNCHCEHGISNSLYSDKVIVRDIK